MLHQNILQQWPLIRSFLSYPVSINPVWLTGQTQRMVSNVKRGERRIGGLESDSIFLNGSHTIQSIQC